MGFWLAPRAMTADDHEHQNRGFMHFWPFWTARHISRANCAEISRDRQGQAACEIFSIERRFRRPKSRFSRFKKTCARRHQRAFPRKSCYFTAVGQFLWKTVEDRHGYAAYCNKHSDELFSGINIDDFERPWTPTIRGFIDFCDFRLRRTSQ